MIYAVVDDCQIKIVASCDRLPVGEACAAQRVNSDLETSPAKRVLVNDGIEIINVRVDVVVAVSCRRIARTLVTHTLDAAKFVGEQRVRLLFNPPRHAGISRSAVRRVVLEAAVLGRVVRGRDDDAVGESRRAIAIVGETCRAR